MFSGFDVDWARSVRAFTAAGKDELVALSERSQVEEALLADYSIDWALVSCALGEERSAVLAALAEAAHALMRVRELRGTAPGFPVVTVDEDGVEEHRPGVDESLDSAERARTAFHLAGLGEDNVLLGRAAWPGGSRAEDTAIATIETGDHIGFLAALREVLDEHDHIDRDPRSLVSLPALGLSARAVTSGLVTHGDLPEHALLPGELLALRSPSAEGCD